MKHSEADETTQLVSRSPERHAPKSPELVKVFSEDFSWLTFDDLKSAAAPKEQILATGLIIFYYVSAVLFYTFYAGWSVMDSVYFATVTFTTVGYGDMSPKTTTEKLFTCCFTFLAVGIIATALGIVMERVLDAEALKEQESGESSTPLETAWAHCCTVLRRLAIIAAVLVTGSTVYAFLEDATMVDSIYWSCITVTTVGYGDMVPKTLAGKLFAMAFMFIGTFIVGRVMSYVVQYPLDQRRKRMEDFVHQQLGEDLQRKELLALIQEVKRLQLGHSHQDYVTRSDFAIAMLVSVGKLPEADLQKALHQFDRLDVHRDQRLDIHDLMPGHHV